jgi:hypothetical protein
MREVRVAPKWKMATDWEGLTGGDGDGDGQKCVVGRDDTGVRGRRTESRVDEGGGDVLRRG